MSESQALAKLHDIHLPAPIGLWPMAPGWYVLILICLALIGLIVYFSRRALKNSSAKREALELLREYEQDYQESRNSQLSAMKISELLRRVALVYFPREDVASLKGDAWLSFLTKTSKRIDFMAIRECLLILPYRPTKEMDLQPLFSEAKRWIKQQRKPCSN